MWPWLVWLKQFEVDGPWSVTLEEAYTHTKTNQMHDLFASCHAQTHTHIYTNMKSIPETDFSLCVCVTWQLRSLRQTGEILLVLPCPSLAISLSQHMWVSATPSPQPSRLASKAKRFNPCARKHTHTHACTYTDIHAAPLAPAWFPWRRDTYRQEVWGDVCVSWVLLEHFRFDPLLTRRFPSPPSLHKQLHPCNWRHRGSPSVITSLMFWCEAECLCEWRRLIQGGCAARQVVYVLCMCFLLDFLWLQRRQIIFLKEILLTCHLSSLHQPTIYPLCVHKTHPCMYMHKYFTHTRTHKKRDSLLILLSVCRLY